MPFMKIGNAYVYYNKAYRYKRYYFEWHNYCGPSPLRKDGELSQRIPKGFWDMVEEFQALPSDEKEKYRVN